jgi:hypothetical protein
MNDMIFYDVPPLITFLSGISRIAVGTVLRTAIKQHSFCKSARALAADSVGFL